MNGDCLLRIADFGMARCVESPEPNEEGGKINIKTVRICRKAQCFDANIFFLFSNTWLLVGIALQNYYSQFSTMIHSKITTHFLNIYIYIYNF